MKVPSSIIPQQSSGTETNTESSIELASDTDAIRSFHLVKERLLEVNRWHEWAGTATASFQLTDKDGNEVSRHAQESDHFKIDIPGPGSVTGEGNDWVRIENIIETEKEGSQWIAINVRPATNPNNERNDVAHFFSDEATSSFVVYREHNKLTAGVYGRNEKPNVETEKVIDQVRNVAVATGAISGFAKIQWKSLVNGLLKVKS